MGVQFVPGMTRRRLAAMGLTVLVATAGAAATPAPVGAGTFICLPLGSKPGGTGTKAFGRFKVECIVGDVAFEYQVQLWERDAGPDQRLSTTGWKPAVVDEEGRYTGKGPSVGCNTEAGKEELYTRVRIRLGGPEGGALPWVESALLTTRTCQ